MRVNLAGFIYGRLCLQGEERERETPTQKSPQEFLTTQNSVSSSATPQPATDTMWFGKERGWNSEKIPPEYPSRPFVAIRAQLQDRETSFHQVKLGWCRGLSGLNLYNLCRLTKTRTRCSHREGRNVRGGWTNTPDVFKSRHDTSAASLSLFCSFSEGMSEQTGSSNSACCEIHGHFSGLDSIVWTCYAMA